MMTLLVVVSLFIPFVGILYGIIGLTSQAKRVQGWVLLVIGLVVVIVWIAII